MSQQTPYEKDTRLVAPRDGDFRTEMGNTYVPMHVPVTGSSHPFTRGSAGMRQGLVYGSMLGPVGMGIGALAGIFGGLRRNKQLDARARAEQQYYNSQVDHNNYMYENSMGYIGDTVDEANRIGGNQLNLPDPRKSYMPVKTLAQFTSDVTNPILKTQNTRYENFQGNRFVDKQNQQDRQDATTRMPVTTPGVQATMKPGATMETGPDGGVTLRSQVSVDENREAMKPAPFDIMSPEAALDPAKRAELMKANVDVVTSPSVIDKNVASTRYDNARAKGQEITNTVLLQKLQAEIDLTKAKAKAAGKTSQSAAFLQYAQRLTILKDWVANNQITAEEAERAAADPIFFGQLKANPKGYYAQGKVGVTKSGAKVQLPPPPRPQGTQPSRKPVKGGNAPASYGILDTEFGGGG